MRSDSIHTPESSISEAGTPAVDALLDRGATCVTILDVSGAALQRAQQRLGHAATIPEWIESDVTGTWALKPVDIWHDRAVFRFLTQPDDQARYVARLRDVLKRGGAAIIA